jgi:hypothetical protein|tara:strand:- start:3067 stop:3837 length:771 start_codon:yes stop_codon:yes gene_type:complete
MANEKTLSYSEGVKGWPSFYSFNPEYMIGMNAYFYTFKYGRLYRHNTNEQRNTYYSVYTPSEITGVFNAEPTTIKLFKTISIESSASWECTNLSTDLGTGIIESSFFEQKEGEWFSYIRSPLSTENFKLRSTHGIGTIDGAFFAQGLNPGEYLLSLPSPVTIDNMISGGDTIYVRDNTQDIKVGVVLDLNRTTNNITLTNPSAITFVGPQLWFYYKNPQAESSGVRGYFMEFTLKNSSRTAVEMFSLGSSVMKSYP